MIKTTSSENGGACAELEKRLLAPAGLVPNVRLEVLET
jgi:hypothetical protein